MSVCVCAVNRFTGERRFGFLPENQIRGLLLTTFLTYRLPELIIVNAAH